MAIPVVWKGPFHVNSGTANLGTQSDPHIIGLSNGNILVAWREASNGSISGQPGDDIIGKIYDAEGNVVQDSFRLNNNWVVNDERDYDIAATHSGGYVLVFVDADLTNTNKTSIRWEHHSSVGSLLASATVETENVAANNLSNPQVAVNQLTHESIITYDDKIGTNTNVKAKVISSAGVTGLEFDAAQNSTGYDRDSEVAVLRNGNIVSVYEEEDAGGSSVEFVVRTHTGASAVAAVQVGNPTSYDPAVASLAGGGFVVAWKENDGTNTKLWYQVFNSNGTTVTSPLVRSGSSNASTPEIVALPDGDFVIGIWGNAPSDASKTISAQRYNADGTTDGSGFVVSNQYAHALEMGATSDGRILFTWNHVVQGKVYAVIWDPRSSTINASDYDLNQKNVVDTEVITGQVSSTTINGDNDDNIIYGQLKGDTIYGNGGNDIIYGGDAVQNSSDDGSDNIYGGGGADTIFAGEGNDSIYILNYESIDNVDGGPGIDRLDMSAVLATGSQAITINMVTGVFTGFGGTRTITDIETFFGTQQNDTIIGDDSDEFINGGGGDDILTGGGGVDNINGNGGNDTINAEGDGGTYNGHSGNDIIRTNGFLVGTTYDGGNDTDTFDILAVASGTNRWLVNLDLQTFKQEGVSGLDSIMNFENVNGSNFVDVITGNAGANVINGNDGADEIDAGDGADTVDGGAGNDTIIDNDGLNSDHYDGGSGDNIIDYSNLSLGSGVTISLASSSVFASGGGSDTIVNFKHIQGSQSGETIIGNNSGNDLFGNGGGDTIEGGFGADTIHGGLGNDTIYSMSQSNIDASAASDELWGDQGDDTLVGSGGVDTMYGGDDNDTLEGRGGIDSMYGQAGDDTFIYRDGTGAGVGEVIDGAVGHDRLLAVASTTTTFDFRGFSVHLVEELEFEEAGNIDTTLMFNADVIEGFQAFSPTLLVDGNSFIYADNKIEITMGGQTDIDLSGWTFQDWGGGDDLIKITGDGDDETFVGTVQGDYIFGSGGADNIDGRSGDDIIIGGSGSDVLAGGAGNDTVSYGSSFAGVIVNLSKQTVAGGYADGDVISGFENVIGSGAKDSLVGTDQVNNIQGLADDDVIEGLDGGDTLNGGTGRDLVRYDKSTAAVSVNLQTQTASGGHADGDVISNFEDVWGSLLYGDTLIGTAQANEIKGYGGDDGITGGDGGDDLDGGDGVDDLHYDESDAAVQISLADETASGGFADGDIIANFENIWGSTGFGDVLTGSAVDNALYGQGGDDNIEGGAGADIIDGGAGNDTASYAGSSAGVTVRLDIGTGVGGDAQGDMLTSIEDLVGSAQIDTLVGSAGVDNNISGGSGGDFLYGLSGADILDGNSGDDLIEGGADADILNGGSGTDTASYAGSSGSVTIRLFNGTGVGSDADGDTLSNFENVVGSMFNDVLIGAYNVNNLLEGGAGTDYIDGLSGTDTASYAGSAGSVTVRLWNGTGVGGDADGDILANIENLIGSANNDVLIGAYGANNLLEGRAGADYLNGLTGNNSATYAGSTDGVTVRLWNGTGSGGDAEGDTIANIQNAIGSTNADILIGTFAASNFLSGGEGNDFLFGLSGNDVIYGGWGDDLLDGGSGSDALNGGVGIDTISYAASSGAVTVRLYNGTGSGNDANGDSYTGIENARGSDFADAIIGAYGVDNILEGGAGADYLDGLSGNNTVSYANSTNSVTVRLWNGTGIGGDAQGDVLVNFANVTGSNNNDTLLGSFATDNIINGGGGDDNMFGLSGNDTFAFNDNFGHDTIHDFVDGSEFMDISDSSLTLADLRIEVVGADTIVHFDQVNAGISDTITLSGITSGIDAGDFIS